jgi:hypothetical protein
MLNKLRLGSVEIVANADGIFTIADLRLVMRASLDDDDNEEHPMCAIGVVLLCAAIMHTTDVVRLATFTCYSYSFISAIKLNMENNRLWIGGLYDARSWLSLCGTIDNEGFWEHIEIASGMLWMPDADTNIEVDSCMVYWREPYLSDRKS